MPTARTPSAAGGGTIRIEGALALVVVAVAAALLLSIGPDLARATTSGEGFVGAGIRWHENFVIGAQLAMTGDFDGDGDADLLATRASPLGTPSIATVALSDGVGRFVGRSVWLIDPNLAAGGRAAVQEVGDVDGDGNDDIVRFREADRADQVCVAPATRTRAAAENRDPDANRAPGSTGCAGGFVFRGAFPGDRACVKPASRAQARADNRVATSRYLLE